MKRSLIAAVLILVSAPLFAQESYLQLPPDSSGKKMRMRTSTQGANTVYSQAFFLDDGSGGGPLGIVGNPIFVTFSNAAIAATQSGSWTVSVSNFPATQPVSASSLPLPSGASTEATLALIKAKTDNLDALLSTRTKPADQQHVIVDTAPTTAVTGPLTDTQLRASAVPVSGTVTANVGTTNGLALDATLTGGTQKTKIVDTAGTNVATVSAAGAVKVDGSAVTQPVTGTFFQGTQPVSGTVTANAGTNLNTSALVLDATATGGTARTKVTDGTTNAAVKAASTAAIATDPALVVAVSPNNSVTVAQATGSNLHVVNDAGAAVIGHVIADTGSTTAVTGNVTAVQATGTNLHAVLDTTSTTAVTQATAANLNAAVVGTGTAGTPAGNILTVQGVAAMTKLLVTPDSVALPSNQSVNVAQVAGTNTVTGGVAGIIAVGGNVANAVAATANPVPVGGIFTTTPATLTTGQTATMQFTAAQNQKNDITTIAGTAPTTAGKIDVKGADGDVFVRQATGTNLHTVIDSASSTLAVNVNSWNGVAVTTGYGIATTGTPRMSLGTELTYGASLTVKTATAAGTGPFFSICGSATTTVRIQKFSVGGTIITTAINADVVIKKTSAATSGGTTTALVRVPYDSNSAAATVATPFYYTVLGTAGTLVGVIDSQMIFLPIAPAQNTPIIFDWRSRNDSEPPVLRGVAQCMEASFGTTTTAAPTLLVSVVWTEK